MAGMGKPSWLQLCVLCFFCGRSLLFFFEALFMQFLECLSLFSRRIGSNLMSEAELAIVRRAYAKQIVFAGGVEGASALEDAYAAVRREAFLGEGPWPILCWGGYTPTPTANPVYLYTDVLVGIIPERGLNNGKPSAHATWINSAGPEMGDHVVHVGAGVGYYSAIMAHMVSALGRVTAIEYDSDLAKRAAANLASWPNVRVLQGDGAILPFDPADVIYVNAGATRPADTWLDRLKEGGRLILPLTTQRNFGRQEGHQGAIFRIERRGAEYLAQWISSVAIFPCKGMRDEVSEAALSAAFRKGGWRKVTRLYRTENIPKERCWVRAPGWSLTSS
jgi:protein-L-isoaspartate(D-aspartate) O-methyltransferase